jgi:hypothetical protein
MNEYINAYKCVSISSTRMQTGCDVEDLRPVIFHALAVQTTFLVRLNTVLNIIALVHQREAQGLEALHFTTCFSVAVAVLCPCLRLLPMPL